MKYEGTVYRPPSEAYSLIVQVTIGCSHNKCSFCSMYKEKKFRIREVSEIIADLEDARNQYRYVKRVFLADGDALVLKTEDLKKILIKIKELFPDCERVGVYAAPNDILRKDAKELKELKNLGLGIAYMGIESGSDKILKNINKGCTSKDIIEAGKKIIESGIKLSVTLISGLGGKSDSYLHSIESAKVVNEINPDYIGLLTLFIERDTPIYDEVQNGTLELLSPRDVMIETKEFIKNLQVDNCVFRSNHASNYAPLAANLNDEKVKLLKEIEAVLEKDSYKKESYRGL